MSVIQCRRSTLLPPLADRAFRGRPASFLALFACLAAVTGFWADTVLSAANTVGGDALRVRMYADLARASAESFPLWIPYKNAGTPLLADPELLVNFLIGPLLMVGGPAGYNLAFNLLLLMTLALHAAAVFTLARVHAVSRLGAAVGGFVATCSGLIHIHVVSGRYTTFLSMAAAIFALAAYRRFARRPGPGAAALLGALVATQLVISGYYALVSVAVLGIYAIGVHRADGHGHARALWLAVRNLSVIGTVAVGLGAVVLLPLLDYQFGLLVRGGFDQALLLPEKGSLLSLLLPVTTSGDAARMQEVFAYGSLALLPGLAVLAGLPPDRRRPEITALALAGGLCLLVTQSGLLPAEMFRALYDSIPLVREIRHGFWFAYFAGLGGLIGALYAFDGRTPSARPGRVAGAGAAMLAGLAGVDALGVLYGEQARSVVLRHLGVLALYVGGSALTVWVLHRGFGGRGLVAAVLVAVALAQAGLPDYSGAGPPRRDNAPLRPEWRAIFESDAGNYRILCGRRWICRHGGGLGIRRVLGFGMYVPPPYRQALSYLVDRPMTAARPHWMAPFACADLVPAALEMLHVRYVTCRSAPDPAAGWTRVATGTKASVWRTPATDERAHGLRLFEQWSTHAGPAPGREAGLSAWRAGHLLLNRSPAFARDPAAPAGDPGTGVRELTRSESVIRARVAADHASVLYVPETYDPRWSATLDGEQVPVLKAQGAFLAVAVPPGRHDVTLSYRPWSFVWGRAISFATLAALLAAAVLCRARQSPAEGLRPA